MYVPYYRQISGTGILTCKTADDLTQLCHEPGATMFNICISGGALSINPLNWKRDETPASIEENKGSVLVNTETNERQEVDGIADATLDLDRGVVVVTTTDNYIPANPVFGDKSFHLDEWLLIRHG